LSERKIWEFRNQIVCAILGLTFDENELSDIFKKLKLSPDGIAAFEMHGSLVHACGTQNKTSRQLEKILKDRFEEYREDVKRIPHKEIYRYIEDKNGTDIRIHFKSNGKLEKYNHTILRITASVANIDR